MTVLVAFAVLAVPAAMAATPSQIYRDYEDNRRLDGRYSIADLQAALRNPAIQGYGGPTIVPDMNREIRRRIGQDNPLRTTRTRSGLPFTGFDLALLTVGGGFLLSVGFGLRRAARAKQR
ncbi:MAG: hypothetical protein ABR583_09865 [Gaiellaceae bacterium]